MTYRRVEPDGTRVYENYVRYKPVGDEARKYRKHKPDDPRAVRWGNEWFLPLDLLVEDQRQLPETRPDTVAYSHMEKPRRCRCHVCKRPEAKVWKKKWRRDRRRQMRRESDSASS